MEMHSIVPPLSTSVDSNPDGYCNFAREEPLVEKCLYCRKEDCKHSGKQTVYAD